MRIFSGFVRVLGMLCLTVLTWFSSVNATPDSTYPFELTTSSTNLFKFKLSAAGDFMIDCGNGGTLSGDGVSGNTITRTGTSPVTYTCSWPSSTVQTVRFGGHATGYSTSSNTAAIRFNIDGSSDSNVKKVASISGSLGQIFGTVASPSTGQSQPRFYSTFWNAINLKGSIPSTLFDGIAGSPVTYMFYQTFYGCSGLTGSIPGNLFAGISGNKVDYMFYQTFSGCSGLTGYVPENLFAGISNNGATSALQYVFDNTGLATSCPENGVQIETGFEYYFSGHVACLECPVLPDGYVRMKNSCVACPIFTNVKEGAMASDDNPEFLHTYSSGTDGCYMTLQYGGFGGNTDIMPAEEFLPGYNPNLDANQGYSSESRCFWNASDNAYTKCINLPIDVYCRYGYIPTQQEINIASQLAELLDSDNPDTTRLRSLIDENISSTPYACHPVDAGYYSTSYENMKKLVEQQPEAELYFQMNIGTTVVDGLLYNFVTGQQTTSISGEYAKCPYTHPYSEPAAKQKSECYANVTFETNGGSNIDTTRVYYGQDLSKLPKPTKAGYGFAGWYTDEDLSGTPLDSDSSINGNTTLYAKWGDLCVAGQYYSMEDGACTSCPTGYTTNGNNEMSIDECYRPCNSSDLPHVSAVSGTMYYNGENNCKIVSCANGWQPQNNPFESVDLKIRKSGTYAKGVNSDDSDYCVVNNSWSNSSDQCSDENLADLNRWEFKTIFDYGTIYGTSTCISNKGTTRGESVPYNKHSSGSSYGQHCWCNLTKFVNSNGEVQEFFMSPWQYEADRNSDSNCKQNCPNRCANLFDAYYAGPFIFGVKVFESFATELPKCKPMTYMITFNLNGGEFPAPVNVPETYTPGEGVILPTPTRENYNFGGWYDNSAYNGKPVYEVRGTYGDKTYYAKWLQNTYYCEPGKYLPAGQTTCESCSNHDGDGYYCPGGEFSTNAESDQGVHQCPEFSGNPYGAINVQEEVDIEGMFGGDYTVEDNIEDCYVTMTFASESFANIIGASISDGFNPDLEINKTSYADFMCAYNSQKGTYSNCFPVGMYCFSGYYVPQSTLNSLKYLYDIETLGDSITQSDIDNIRQKLTEPYSICETTKPGYYTAMYDIMMESDGSEDDIMATNVGMLVSMGMVYDIVNDKAGNLSDYYKKCPTEYPNSEPKAWKKADCYANISFDSKGGNTIEPLQVHYTNVKKSGYTISDLPTPTKTGYGFAGWYTNSRLSGSPVAKDTVLTGNVTLYAKYREPCDNGQYYNGKTCAACPSGYTSNGNSANSINECYRPCNSYDVAHTSSISGVIYYDGKSDCRIVSCENGWEIYNSPLKNLDSSINYINTYYRYYNDGSYQCNVATPDGDSGYKTTNVECSETEEFSDLSQNEFKSTFDYGTIYGKSTCQSHRNEVNDFFNSNVEKLITDSSYADTFAQELSVYVSKEKADEYMEVILAYLDFVKKEQEPDEEFMNKFLRMQFDVMTVSGNNIESYDNGSNCYCQLTKINTNGKTTQLGYSDWYFDSSYDTQESCQLSCASNCESLLSNSDIRPVVFDAYSNIQPMCAPLSYAITFNLNGGEFPAPVNVPTNYTVSANDVVHLPTPTRENYNFGGWYDNSALSGNPIANIQPGTYGDKTYFAKWVQNEYYCEPGYYLPANKTTCEPCDNANNNDDKNKEYYCPGGLFPMNETTVQGAIQCPTFTNETEGAYTLVEYTTFAPVGGDIGVADSIEDCAVSLLYGNKLEMFYTDTDSLTQDSNYNPDLPINTNNAQTSVYCVYNQITNAYNKCVPHFIIGSVCNKGYYITQEEYNIAKSVLTGDNSDNMLRNLLGDHGACHPAEPGYYTTLYDYTIDGLIENTTYTADTVSMGLYVGYIIPEQINGEQTKMSDLYKKCPDEYPGSAPKSWKKADCYATLTFDSRGGDTINARQIHYAKGKDAGYTVVNLPTPTRKFNTFVGWYDNPEFRGSAITSDTVLSGNTTLYAKWSRDDFVCESGVWFHLGNNVKTCLMSEKPESKSFAIYQNGSTYYLNMTTKEVPVNEDTATKMKVYYNGREYCLYDESVSLD